jgi:acyl-coenzyme A synthetase/AMP-(fatty) acid ligase
MRLGPMNFARDIVDAADPSARALVALGRGGDRRTWSFGEVSDGAARLAGTLRARGVRRGDVVATLIGNRPEWVLSSPSRSSCGPTTCAGA